MVVEEFGIGDVTGAVSGAVTGAVDQVKNKAEAIKEEGMAFWDDLNPFKWISDIIGSLGGIIDFFKKLLALITNPAKFLPLLLMYILGFGLWVGVLLWYKIVSIWPFIEGIFFLYYFVIVILVELIISLVFFAIFIIFCVIAVGMWIADLATFGLVRWLTRCENHIDAWFKQANFAYDNVAKRLLFAQLPCASRFKPQGFWCVRQPSWDPDYCPQQQIYRIYKGMGVSSPWIMDKINENTSFKLMNPAQKAEALKTFFQNRQGFLNKCSKTLSQHKHIIRCICANYKNIKLENESDRALLAPLCKQVFCYSADKESFCSRFPDDDIVADKANLEDIVRKLTRYMVLVVFGTLFLLIFMYNRGWTKAAGGETSLLDTVTGVLKGGSNIYKSRIARSM
jgi:hypothetical protein